MLDESCLLFIPRNVGIGIRFDSRVLSQPNFPKFCSHKFIHEVFGWKMLKNEFFGKKRNLPMQLMGNLLVFEFLGGGIGCMNGSSSPPETLAEVKQFPRSEGFFKMICSGDW